MSSNNPYSSCYTNVKQRIEEKIYNDMLNKIIRHQLIHGTTIYSMKDIYKDINVKQQ